MDKDIFRKGLAILESGQSVAMVTVTKNTGSTPGKAGAVMLVSNEGLVAGTVGGGKVEFSLISKSIDALKSGISFDFRYELDHDLKMICGGTMEGFVNILCPNKRLFVFGAGHIAQNLSVLAKELSFDLYVIDERTEFQELPEFQNIREYIAKTPEKALENIEIGCGDFIVITTKGHLTDKAALEQVIKSDASYIGMIGSLKKTKEILTALREEGVEEKDLAKVHAPIGLKFSNNTPAEIAMGILAEILMVKNKICRNEL